ncbi:hypothetical protein OQA88_4984 [Cercophora sp. LCS_1]
MSTTTTSADRTIVLPGDKIDASLIPTHPKHHLRLGPGVRHVPPSEIIPTVAGQLIPDHRKTSLWVESSSGRYIPFVSDLVIGQVQRSTGDFYYVSLNPYTPNASLPHLAFEGATKKTRPQLAPGALVYARVTLANKHMDPELECVSSSTGKAEGLGPLVGGMIFDVSLGMARRLLMAQNRRDGGIAVLDLLGDEGLGFEIAVGRNGKVWIGGDNTKTIIATGRAIRETDEKDLNAEQQKALVKRLIREMR